MKEDIATVQPSVLEALRAARALIDTPRKWTKGKYARKEDGTSTATADPEAACFCMQGALYRAAPNLTGYYARETLERFIPTAFDCLENFNDRANHGDVLAAFDRAIEFTTLSSSAESAVLITSSTGDR